jgi:hypothetical protein
MAAKAKGRASKRVREVRRSSGFDLDPVVCSDYDVQQAPVLQERAASDSLAARG